MKVEPSEDNDYNPDNFKVKSELIENEDDNNYPELLDDTNDQQFDYQDFPYYYTKPEPNNSENYYDIDGQDDDGKEFKCEFCNHSCDSKATMKQHVNRAHKGKDKYFFQKNQNEQD